MTEQKQRTLDKSACRQFLVISEGDETMDYEKEIRELKARVKRQEKTLKLFSWSAFGNAITIVILAINLIRVVILLR